MKKLLSVLLFSGSFTQVFAYDLAYAYQQALSYNATYLQQIASSDATIEQKNIALGKLLPQISGSASLSENYFNQGGIEAYYHQPVYSAQLTQVVFDWSKFSTFSKGQYSAQIGNLQLENAKQQLLVTVAQSYMDVLYAQDTLLSITKTKEALEKQMNQAKKSFEVGTVTIADVNDAQAGYDSSAAQEIQATNDLIYKKNIFQNITGLDPEQIQPVVDDLKLVTPNPQSPDKWSQMGESGNLNIKVSQKQVEMANQDVHIAISGHLPTLNVNGTYQYQDTGGLDNTNATAAQVQQLTSVPGTPLSSYANGGVGLQLNVPIYSGGSVNAQVRQARATYVASQQQLVSVERQTDQNIRNSYWQVLNGVGLVKAQQTALKSATTKLDSDQLGYQVGVRNSVDLVNSQKNYYQTFQTYQQSRYQYLMARIQLRYLDGSINDKFIQDINTNIKPNK
jgi:outer membrane protein